VRSFLGEDPSQSRANRPRRKKKILAEKDVLLAGSEGLPARKTTCEAYQNRLSGKEPVPGEGSPKRKKRKGKKEPQSFSPCSISQSPDARLLMLNAIARWSVKSNQKKSSNRGLHRAKAWVRLLKR